MKKKVDVTDLLAQENLYDAMEYIREYLNASAEYLKDKTDADDAYYEAYKAVEYLAWRLDLNDLVDFCATPIEWLKMY